MSRRNRLKAKAKAKNNGVGKSRGVEPPDLKTVLHLSNVDNVMPIKLPTPDRPKETSHTYKRGDTIERLYLAGTIDASQFGAARKVASLYYFMSVSPMRALDPSKQKVDTSVVYFGQSGNALDAMKLYGQAFGVLSLEQKKVVQSICCDGYTIRQFVGSDNTKKRTGASGRLKDALTALAEFFEI